MLKIHLYATIFFNPKIYLDYSDFIFQQTDLDSEFRQKEKNKY